MYAKYFKRILDLFLASISLVVLSPLLVTLTIVGAIVMRGNPFYVQERPGWHEKIFRIVKFRTMTNKRSAETGELLPDKDRLTPYGRLLRRTSLDELPELVNIVKGDLAIVGPRPLLVKYLPLYSERQRLRHSVRPGLTGYAQVHGRNMISWEEKFDMDLWYIRHLSFQTDLAVILATIKTVFKCEGITSETSVTMEEFHGSSLASSDVP